METSPTDVMVHEQLMCYVCSLLVTVCWKYIIVQRTLE